MVCFCTRTPAKATCSSETTSSSRTDCSCWGGGPRTGISQAWPLALRLVRMPQRPAWFDALDSNSDLKVGSGDLDEIQSASARGEDRNESEKSSAGGRSRIRVESVHASNHIPDAGQECVSHRREVAERF